MSAEQTQKKDGPDEEYYKKLQQKYDHYKTQLKMERDQDLPSILSDLTKEVEAITKKEMSDLRHIYILCHNYLPEYFKILLQRRYLLKESDAQILVTQFFNVWMMNRVPILSDYYSRKKAGELDNEEDLIHRVLTTNKELEMLAMIFDPEMEMYNFRVSKNTSDIQEKLYQVLTQIQTIPQESQTKSDPTDDVPMQDESQPTQDKAEVAQAKKLMSTSYYFVHNINSFHKCGGFDQILKIFESQHSKKSSFTTYLSILNILNSMKEHFQSTFWFDYAIKVKDYCLAYIQTPYFSENLRTVQRKDLTSFTSQVEKLLDSIVEGSEDKTDQVYYISENLELEIALKCLQMPVLEKRFIGYSILQTKIFQATSNKGPSSAGVSLPQRRWLDTERLIQWMDQVNIFYLIFGESLHSEVIKKSYPVLGFLYANGKIGNKEFDVIWDCATKKHEAYKVAILKALATLASKCSVEHLRYLFNKIKSIQLSEVDKFGLNLLRSIAKMLSGSEGPENSKGERLHQFKTRSQSNSLKGKRKGTGLNIDTTNHHLFATDGVGHFDDETFLKSKRDANIEMIDKQFQMDEQQVWAQDDMSRPLNDQQLKGKKTRSLSLGGDKEAKKGVSSLISKVSEAKSQVKKPQGNTLEDQKGQDYEEEKGDSNMVQYSTPASLNIGNLAQFNMQNEDNPLEVPKDKQDINTADDENSRDGAVIGDSPLQEQELESDRDGDVGMMDGGNLKDEIFKESDHTKDEVMGGGEKHEEPVQKKKAKGEQDLEEEKGGDGNRDKLVMQASLHELFYDQTLGLEDLEKRQLASDVLGFLWSLCLEDSVSEHNLSLQIHKQSLEQLVQILVYFFPQGIFMHIQKCVTCIQHNYSVMSVQFIMQKLIQSLNFPLQQSKHLPRTKKEFLQCLEESLNITNECLSSYIEFKRISLSLIFDQLGSQEQEQENLETQSSLDNDDERSSLQSAQKNNQNLPQDSNLGQTANRQGELLNIQEEQFNLKESNTTGSLFVSPKSKIEEEFKGSGLMPNKTQSYQGDQVLQPFSRNNDFAMAIRENDSEDKAQKMMNTGVGLSASIGSIGSSSKHINSSSKRMQGGMQHQQMYGGQQRNEFSLQTNVQNDVNVEMNLETANNNLGNAQQNNQGQSPNNQAQQPNNRDFLNSLITNEVYKYSYYQEMHQRLDFLRFLIGNCPSLLKPQHIQILWECLVINAFYEKERDQFFGWCTQILKSAQQLPESKDLEQLGSSIFTDDCLEMLFFDTLLKLDFRYITETMYDCFERFLIYINEMYGQIVTNSAFDSAFEVFETKLIGVEALWEIVLCARNDKVYKKAAEFLHKLYKKMSPELVKDRLNEIKEDLLSTCMEQIKTGLKDIQLEFGDAYDIPIYQHAASIEDPKNRIARSIQQLCKFIDDFEGLRDRASKAAAGKPERDVNVICSNQIGHQNCQGPKKVNLTVPLSTKVGVVKEEIGNAIFPKRSGKEISIMYRGKDLMEDLKTLKELGINPDSPPTFMFSLQTTSDLADKIMQDEQINENDEMMNDIVEQLKCFLGGEMELPVSVIKLAIKKCNLNLEEALLMVTDENQVNDLQEEVRRLEETNNQQQIILIEEVKVGGNEDVVEEAKINLIISNRKEYFELLFDLLNLGISEITTAAWNLLVQIPVNKQLLNQIRTLSIVQQNQQGNWCQIVDPTNVFKMLYSLQIINSLISVNNDSMSEAENKEREEWRLKFLDLGGFDHLYTILITSDVDDILGCAVPSLPLKNLQNQIAGSGLKRKGKQGNQKNKGALASTSNVNGGEQKDDQQMQNNQAKCLGYLISLVKIFLLAALLKVDEKKLLTLIVQSSTSPYRKPKNIKSVPPNKINQLFGNQTGPGSDSSREDNISRDTSSVNTPKWHSFHSSNSATPPQEENQSNKGATILTDNVQHMNKSIDPFKMENLSQSAFNPQAQNDNNNIFTQVDDFPRLVDQMSDQLVGNLLENVVNFNELIQKLLHTTYKAVMFCDSSDVSHLVQNSLDLLLPCVVWKPEKLLQEIYKFEHLESLLIRTLMFNQNENVRKSLERTFKVICTQLDIKRQDVDKDVEMSNASASLQANEEQEHYGDKGQSLESPKLYILKILLNNLPDLTKQSDQCEEFFNLTTSLIKACHSSFKIVDLDQHEGFNENQPIKKSQIILEDGNFSANGLLSWCIQQLKQRPTYEDKYSNYTDKILAGYLQLTQSVLEIHPELKKVTGQKSIEHSGQSGHDMVKTIFDFLFLLPSLEDQQQKHIKMQNESKSQVIDAHPKCKKKFTRKKAFNLLLTLCHQSEENYISLLQQLYAFHSQIQKSQKVVSLAEFDTEVGMRAATGYVGLKNFGCTCYMNALMQQLFMIKDLRKGILRAEIHDQNQDSNVMYQLQQIFANLQESEKQYYSPLGFTQAFSFDGQPINVRIQQDTHEFYNLLCDNIEQVLKGSKDEQFLKETIGGYVCYETKSLEKEYPYTSEREEPFFAIPLDIKNKKNISEALDLYIKPDDLEGDNKYHCDKYDRKVNAQRRAFLSKLSNTMVINLKRFEFDYNTMQKFKVNDYCEFPMQINLKPWTKEGIREREKQLRKEAKNKKSGEVRVQNPDKSNKDEEEDIEEAKEGEEIAEELEEEEDSEQSLSDKLGEKEDEDLFGAGGVDLLAGINGSIKQAQDKKGGEALDEEMESGDDFESQNQINNTGGYDDDEVDDLIDIAADDEFRKQQAIQPKSKLLGGRIKTHNSMKIDKKKLGGLSGTDSKEEEKVALNSEGKLNVKKAEVTKKSKFFGGTKKHRFSDDTKDDKYYLYQLVGVLVHSGSADAGHYYSFIKERGSSNRWLEFNDIHVREFKEADLEKECFGGNQETRTHHAANMLDDFNPSDARYFERCRNAYLLFYERVHPLSSNQSKKEDSSMSKSFINGIEKRIYERIWEENGAFMKLKMFFDQEYFQFVREYVNLYNFKDVHYFSQDHSSTYLLKKMRELTQQYETEYPELKVDYKARFQAIEQEGKVYGDRDVFGDFGKITEDPGLYTLKLATILSQDIIMKVKDVQSFVQWMHLMNQLYGRHAVACVWFIKYMTDNRDILEELLLNSQFFEVRESFARLLTTAISTVQKNEESYFEEYDQILDFDCDLVHIQEGNLSKRFASKSAVIRFMDLYFNNMLDSVRVHWRRYEEYFTVLNDFIFKRFPETRYIVQHCRGIYKLLEFMMNSSTPFYSTIKYKMGDKFTDPSIIIPLDILHNLIRSCLTTGIQNVQTYSYLSYFQNPEQSIPLPKEDIEPFFNKSCFTVDLLFKAPLNQDSLKNIVVHLSWGDLEKSKWFVAEIMDSLKVNRTKPHELDNHYKCLTALLTLGDSEDLQDMRVQQVFNFESFDSNLSLIRYLESHRMIYKIFVLKTLMFIGDLCAQSVRILRYLRTYQGQLSWVFATVRSYPFENLPSSEIKDMNLSQMTETCLTQYMKILDDDENVQPVVDDLDLVDKKLNDNVFDLGNPQEIGGHDTSFKDQNFNNISNEGLLQDDIDQQDVNRAFIHQNNISDEDEFVDPNGLKDEIEKQN